MCYKPRVALCLAHLPSPNPPGGWPGRGLEPASPADQRRSPAVSAFADSTCILNGRVDELALYQRLLTADERAWLSRNNGQGRAYTENLSPRRRRRDTTENLECASVVFRRSLCGKNNIPEPTRTASRLPKCASAQPPQRVEHCPMQPSLW